jgi:hypothetical protein
MSATAFGACFAVRPPGFESRGSTRGSNPECQKEEEEEVSMRGARWSAGAAGAFGLSFDVGANGGEVA